MKHILGTLALAFVLVTGTSVAQERTDTARTRDKGTQQDEKSGYHEKKGDKSKGYGTQESGSTQRGGKMMGGKHALFQPNDIKWTAAPPELPKGAQIAVLSGDPGSDTGTITLRLKMPKNYKVAAHHHPTEEHLTVIEGDFHLGMGDKLIEDGGTQVKEGGFTMMPKGVNHYAYSKTGATIQLTFKAPWGITYVNPADDPRQSKAGTDMNEEDMDNEDEEDED